MRLSVNVITGGRYYKAFEDDVPNDQLSDSMRKFAIPADPPVAPPKPSPAGQVNDARKRTSESQSKRQKS